MRAEFGAQTAETTGKPTHKSAFTSQELTLEELREWGESLGQRLQRGSVVTLQGDLGTGKTTLAQAICRGVGIEEDVTSPTFALVNQYEARDRTVFHLDLYRLSGPADLTNIGWDDIINSDAVVIIEWPERAGHRLPEDTTVITLEYVPGDDSRRRLTLSHGA
ncbi:MAG TPA: tRNA (adenosine(37)-N6)-threonylcarbamoyltransferase complex ATPase subunit type 1 TsaE [Gemmatimonadaceae bacterium]